MISIHELLSVVKDFLTSDAELPRLVLADVFESVGEDELATSLRTKVKLYIGRTTGEGVEELEFLTKREAQSYFNGFDAGTEMFDPADAWVFWNKTEAEAFVGDTAEDDEFEEDDPEDEE